MTGDDLPAARESATALPDRSSASSARCSSSSSSCNRCAAQLSAVIMAWCCVHDVLGNLDGELHRRWYRYRAGSLRSRRRDGDIHCDWHLGRTCLVRHPRLVRAATVQAGHGSRRGDLVMITAALSGMSTAPVKISIVKSHAATHSTAHLVGGGGPLEGPGLDCEPFAPGLLHQTAQRSWGIPEACRRARPRFQAVADRAWDRDHAGKPYIAVQPRPPSSTRIAIAVAVR